MKYIASIKFGPDSYSRSFNKISDAKTWLDSQNNNLEHTTVICEVDENWNTVDWFYYTKGEE